MAERARAGGKANKPAKEEKSVLVIVETPDKALTMKEILGKSYSVLASMGHLIDLPKSRIGIDVENDFEPEYLTIRGKAKLLKEMRRAAGKSALVLLASDNDREGESISYHIQNALREKEPALPIRRIVFNEITPAAIMEAVANSRLVDETKASAQKARRVLDRIVGYNLSPLLWKKVKNGLSAGRVQSVALRLICDREREVESFVPEEYWSVKADFRKGRKRFSGELALWRGEKPSLTSEGEARAIVNAIASSSCVVADVRESERSVRPKPPYTTSQLQQDAADRLGFSSKKTMRIAQQLYEGVDVGSARIGLISYMRTDSVRVRASALEDLRRFIASRFPAELPESPNVYEGEAGGGDAREAIRPTMVELDPDSARERLTKDQHRLYSLVWERFVASQMTDAKSRISSADLRFAAADGSEALFRVDSSRLAEKGFYKTIDLSASKEERERAPVPELRIDETLVRERVEAERHFTQGASRFTDASVVKALDERGIGRPSTYAPIISVLLERYYVTRENKRLVPTALGRAINDMLTAYFPELLEVGFTAGMEAALDRVEEGDEDWVKTIRAFYGPFKTRVDEVSATIESFRGSLDEATDLLCDKCGKPMLKKLGRYGFFLACSGFPGCKSVKSISLAKCPRPDCGGEIVARRRAKGGGREFYGCTRYPECDFVTYYKPTGANCPKCGQFLVEKFDKKQGPRESCVNPDCESRRSSGEEGERGSEV